MTNEPEWHGTTIVCVRKGGKVVIAGDGQVSAGPTILKGNARKVRPLANGAVIAGFAGATADAFALFERLEQKLERFPSQLARACVELAKDWRTDRALRRLDAMLIVADKEKRCCSPAQAMCSSRNIEVIAVGSGGNFAFAAARALYEYIDDPEAIARKAMEIAAQICVYTNTNLTVEKLDG